MAMVGIGNVVDSWIEVDVVVLASKNLNSSFCMWATKQMDSKIVNRRRTGQENLPRFIVVLLLSELAKDELTNKA